MTLDFDKLKTLRKKRGLTQADAGRLSGIGTAQRWNDIESGRRPNITLETLDAIAKALGVNPRHSSQTDISHPFPQKTTQNRKHLPQSNNRHPPPATIASQKRLPTASFPAVGDLIPPKHDPQRTRQWITSPAKTRFHNRESQKPPPERNKAGVGRRHPPRTAASASRTPRDTADARAQQTTLETRACISSRRRRSAEREDGQQGLKTLETAENSRSNRP